MKKRGLNKKGQGLTIGTVIVIILGITVLVFLIIGFSQGWDLFFGKFELTPSALETTAQACKGYALAELKIDYCKFRNVGGKEYVNCETPMIKDNYPEAVFDAINCDLIKTRTKFCEELGTGAEDVKVNEVKCSETSGSDSASGPGSGSETSPTEPPAEPPTEPPASPLLA